METNTKREYPDFIAGHDFGVTLRDTVEDAARVRDVIARSMAKVPLTVEECAVLLAVKSQPLVEEIFAAACELKKTVYGNRIVIFAPLYIGNHCVNDCQYCAFRRSLRTMVRKTLNDEELRGQVLALEQTGHKRLILVYGEHPSYTPEFMAHTVKLVYSVKSGKGEIRRVNINAAPLDHDGYRIVKDAGIGTYQIFQETYHRETYAKVHPSATHKGDYMYRLHGLTRAYEAGCDDVGIGALFGLYDWRYEVLGLVAHSRFLMDRFGCGPHTISFPRLRPAHGVEMDKAHLVCDADFKKLVAILRLCVPYTGMILTARETPEMRREVMGFGVSQIDAGTRIELAGYTMGGKQQMNREQFQIGDVRPMDEIVRELLQTGYVPSFCTSCYRRGRTGRQFMEFAIPGFIRNFCTPNALLTLDEYLQDYSCDETRQVGRKVIERELGQMDDSAIKVKTSAGLQKIRTSGDRDIYL
ncbi:MAG: [FeFe] hydrogenase H-cluster radical SAM maturase HydG [bacterium]